MSEVIAASGYCYLSQDEGHIIAGLRAVKQQGRGEVYVKIDAGKYVTWAVKPDFGNVAILNRLLDDGT